MKRALQHKHFWRVESAKTSRENFRTKQRVLISPMEELHMVRRCSMKTLRKDLVGTMQERLDLKLGAKPNSKHLSARTSTRRGHQRRPRLNGTKKNCLS